MRRTLSGCGLSRSYFHLEQTGVLLRAIDIPVARVTCGDLACNSDLQRARHGIFNDFHVGLGRIVESGDQHGIDRKSTRLNFQSLMRISYAVFCLKKNRETSNGIKSRAEQIVKT